MEVGPSAPERRLAMVVSLGGAVAGIDNGGANTADEQLVTHGFRVSSQK